MGTVTAYGRDFSFEDNVPPAEQQSRILNWMKTHAPDELQSGAAAAAATPAPTPAPDSGGRSKLREMVSNPVDFWTVGRGKDMARDTGNFWRTAAQGMLPYADEGIAGIRSLMGTDYDTALADERARLKEFGDKHGETVKTLTELGGGLATIPLTMGAGALLQGARALPYAGAAINAASKYSGAEKLAAVAAKYPKIATMIGVPAVGGASGAVAGFGAGEGDFEHRMDNAMDMAPVGAVLGTAGFGAMKGASALTSQFKDNRVANFLRKRLVQDRGEQYRTNPNMPRTASGGIDTNDPRFANLAGDELEQALAKERSLSNRTTDVMTGDVMPGTVESTLLHPGEDTAQLRRQIVKRQYDTNLPEAVARDASQFGHVGKWFDRAFGPDVFRRTDDQLEAHLRAEADRNFTPAYRRNIRSPDLDNALQDPYVQKAWADAVTKMESEGKPIGVINPIGANGQPTISQYNTEFLHKIKRTMADMAEAARTRPEGTTGKDTARIIGNAEQRLNKAIMDANPQYKHAMEQFGEEAEVLKSLRQGREEVFGPNPDQIDKGIGAEDILARINDPNMTPTQKEMYRMGAARALRANLLGSESKKFTHNWADILANPNIAEKYQALIPESEKHLWPIMREQIMQLSNRRKNLEGAIGNSKTATRQQLVEELEQPSHLAEIIATGVNPHAPSTWRNWAAQLLDQKGAGRRTANETAKILSGVGPTGNQSSVDQIRNLLSRYQNRNAEWQSGRWRAALTAPQITPWDRWNAQDNP